MFVIQKINIFKDKTKIIRYFAGLRANGVDFESKPDFALKYDDKAKAESMLKTLKARMPGLNVKYEIVEV